MRASPPSTAAAPWPRPHPDPFTVHTMPTIATPTPAQVQIDALAANYAKQRHALGDVLAEYNEAALALHSKFRRRLVEASGRATGALDTLRATIEANRELFEKPKTWTLHGIKLGLQKGKGSLDWDDTEQLVARIQKHFSAEEAELLLRVKKEPVVDALKELDAKTLAKLGVRCEETGEVVVVRAVDGEVEKLLKTLLKEGARVDTGGGEARQA